MPASNANKEILIFRICAVVRSIEQTVGLADLDFCSRSILTFVGEAEMEQRKLKVSDVIRSSLFGTPPTVYSRLRDLEEAGWIEYSFNPSDGREKMVLLSRTAKRAYRKMSTEIQKRLLSQ